jgi:hypothetical protein
VQVRGEPGIGGHLVKCLQLAVREQREQVDDGDGTQGVGHERRLSNFAGSGSQGGLLDGFPS